MSKPYHPANSTEGTGFLARFCNRCVEDRHAREDEDYGGGCSILADVFWLSADHPDYPKQWIEEDNGDNPRCTAFVEDVGQDMPIRNVTGIKLTWAPRQSSFISKQNVVGGTTHPLIRSRWH